MEFQTGLPGGIVESQSNEPTTDIERLEEYAAWKTRYAEDQRNPREQYRQVSNIALCMGYDLIDKLRWLEKETLHLSEDEIAERVPHLAAFLDHFKEAYLLFSDVDL